MYIFNASLIYLFSDDVPSLQIPKCSERKSNGAFPKRVSMLKRLSVMNSIAETNETECGMTKSPNSQDTKSTPRRSKRLSNLIPVDTLSYSPMENADDDSTPRRSLRLMKMSSTSDSHPVSPFQEKNMNVSSRRRSVRLIDLNTPEKGSLTTSLFNIFLFLCMCVFNNYFSACVYYALLLIF